MIRELNKIWKSSTGKDLTEKEAWDMVEFVRLLMEHADRNLDEIIAQQTREKNLKKPLDTTFPT